MERPYIIFALRRTGGTSLMSFMSGISTYQTVEHEPFNVDRIWGGATRRFNGSQDATLLRDEIAALLAQKPNIKHCIDVVPPEVTRILIEECARNNYTIFVLTRRDEAQRLLSLFLAVATDAWGQKEARRIYPLIRSGDQVPRPIDLSKVAGRVQQDMAAVGRLMTVLRNRAIDHQWLVFEELYGGEVSIETQACGIAARMGIDINARDPRLAAFAGTQSQGSGEIETFVPEITELKAILSKVVVS